MLQRKSTQNVLSTQFVSERDPSENLPASHAAARCVPKSGVSTTMNTTATTVPTNLLAIAAAICWAVYSLFMGEMTREFGTLAATRKVFFYGLVTILPLLGGQGGSFAPQVLSQPAVWSNLLFLGLVASLLCFLIWNLAIDRLGNVTSTNYVYLNPVFTLISASILLGERMTPVALIGSVAILAGVIWAGHDGR